MDHPHPWKLVAPWYRWKQQGGAPRDTRPAIQKYEAADFVNRFLKDPQRSLRFNDDDLVVTYEHVAKLSSGDYAGKYPRLVAPAAGAPPGLAPPPESVARPGTVRKLFLDTHKRFYLVVFELHCDAPGFPVARREDACEVGFVVRRRRKVMSAQQVKDAAVILNDLDLAALQLQSASAKAEIEALDAAYQEELDSKKGLTRAQFLQRALRSPLRKAKAAALQKLAAAQAKLQAWSSGVPELLEGWVPSEFDKIGAWQSVEEEPQVVTEAIFPMYPLVPDPRIEGHAGAGRTIYFGVIPTGSADTTDDGNARFDPGSTYEVRCFVRRHEGACPKKKTRDDCRGPLVWSKPTEPYQLAAHFDLIGTSQRPVTMQLPNIPELAAQAASLPPARLAPFKMASPNPQSNLGFNLPDPEDPGGAKKDPPGTIPEICSFAIPLITIVATFVFKLFLPIVTFVFGLSFLLKLKFCIPPSLQIGAKVDAALKIDAPSIDLDFDLDVQIGAPAFEQLEIDLGLDPNVATAADVRAKIHEGVVADLDAAFGADVRKQLTDTYSDEALVSLEADLGKPQDPGERSLTVRMDFEAPVTRAEVGIA